MRNKPSLLMNSLFSMTRKRQLTILRQLECYGHLSGQQLAQACGASRRTIISDIEELRQLFGASTILASASNGYELVIQELAEYQEKKRALLADDPNLLFLHFLCQQETGIPEKLAAITGLGNQTFLKQCRQLQTLFAAYELTLNKKQWCLEGAEGNIRYFYKAFYFEEEEQPHQLFEQLAETLTLRYRPSLPIDPVVSLQWTKVFLLRAQQGGRLEENWEMADFCRLFLEKTGFVIEGLEVCRSLSQQERCVLLFLMMADEGVLSFLLKHPWVEETVPFDPSDSLRETFPKQAETLREDRVFVQVTLAVMLLDRLFHVPPPLQRDRQKPAVSSGIGKSTALSSAASRYLVTLGETYLNKQQLKNKQLMITYHLSGNEKIKGWIKQRLRDWLVAQGVDVVVEATSELSIFTARQVLVTDQPLFLLELEQPIYRLERPIEPNSIERLGKAILADFLGSCEGSIPSEELPATSALR
ncbi:HTH domain-containing protein [Enterococcus casseliflavus]|uniref:HTH domain-containing protein n=1 Tax=Enterococcus casseliflavus TaxID=37734 RepID=UPI00233117F6|nr:HTH domain-containing protein [Enterococcus casseliflavus]MDB1692054.1 HTH domain-containing protein [Enterococcus casseliflavus]